jgi:hypothetical protein
MAGIIHHHDFFNLTLLFAGRHEKNAKYNDAQHHEMHRFLYLHLRRYPYPLDYDLFKRPTFKNQGNTLPFNGGKGNEYDYPDFK